MPTQDEQFAAAKAYIQAKEYDKARRILKRIQHPKADEWLSKIDQMPEMKAKRRRQIVMLVLIGVSIVIIAVAATYLSQTINGPF